MDRRTFLKIASTGGALLLAGCQEDPIPTSAPPSTPEVTWTPGGTSTGGQPPTPTANETRTTEEPAMRNVRVDVSEGDEVSGLVANIGSGERLVFPSGRFTWRSEARVTADDWGIRCQEDTVFEVPIGMGDGGREKVLVTYDEDGTADNVHLENLTFDSPGRAAPSLHVGVRNMGRIDGLHYRMNGPRTDGRQENGVRAFVENQDGRLLIDGYRQYNNGDLGAYGNGDSRIGIWVGRHNRGTVHLRNPVLQGFPNNACYVSRQPGTVVIEGGLLANNNVSAIRVSGGVEVRNTTIYIDVDRYLDGPGSLEAQDHNTRGIWGDNRQAGTDGGLVTGVSCILRSYRRCTGLATILENPRITIRNSQFMFDSDIEGIRAHDGEIVVSNCDFDGRSNGSTAGVGNITGSGGHIALDIDPGDVPVQSMNPTFDWTETHLETPGRPTPRFDGPDQYRGWPPGF